MQEALVEPYAGEVSLVLPLRNRAPEPTGRLVFATPQDDLGIYEQAPPEAFYCIKKTMHGLDFSIILDRNFALRAVDDQITFAEQRVLTKRLNETAESYGMKTPTKRGPSCDFFASQTPRGHRKVGLLRSLTANPQDLPDYLSHLDNLKLVTPLDNLTKDAPRGSGHLVYVTSGSIYTEAQASALKKMFETWVDFERKHLVAKSHK